jgi:hypothetical protein
MLLSGSRGHVSPRLESPKNMSFSTPIIIKLNVEDKLRGERLKLLRLLFLGLLSLTRLEIVFFQLC